MNANELSADQLAQARAHGLSAVDAARQLKLYADPPAPIRLLRACAAGDGLRVLDAQAARRLAARHGQALATRRVVCFVPASGAASRMFKTPLAYLRSQGPVTLAGLARAAGGSDGARELLEVFENLPRFAFYESLAAKAAGAGFDLEHLSPDSDLRPVLGLLLEAHGLDCGRIPKGLLVFHSYADGARTPVEEHLVDAAEYARDGEGVCRLHFTVSAEHEGAFRDLCRRVLPRYESRYRARFEVVFSTQHPSTDAIAVDATNRPFLLADGSLFFRPGGHGALIENLRSIDADVVFIRNIDNVVPDHEKADTLLWKRALLVMLVELQERVFAALDALEAGAAGAIEDARKLMLEELGIATSDSTTVRELLDLMDRPLRVCGMVRNRGEPGGGPFWVEMDGRQTLQIVEASQVATDDAEQDRIFRTATYFNPVDLVCAIRDRRGRRHDLRRYVDDEAVFIVEKSKDGSLVKSLERPGLWNGAMARWNTVFVEVPGSTFNPVKTVNALLSPTHQPANPQRTS